MKLRLSAAAALLMAASPAFAQNELSNFTATGRGGVSNTFVTDYQSIGINPANLGRRHSHYVTFSFFETGLGFSSQSLRRNELSKFIFNTSEKLTQEQKQHFAQAFNSDNALNMNTDITTFALAVMVPEVGGFAFSNRHRANLHVGLNKNAAEVLFLGLNAPLFNPANFDPQNPPQVSAVLEGSRMQGSWVNEYNFAFGRKVVEQPGLEISAGAGYKYIQGVGVMDVTVEKGEVKAYSALSPIFGVDYGDVTTDPNFNFETRKSVFRPIGTGHGFDFGITAEVQEQWRFGASVTDIGRMTWKGNLLTARDQPVKRVESEGINTFNFFEEVGNLFGSDRDSLLNYQPQKERKESLPTRLRLGAGYRISDRFEAGIDFTQPLNNEAGNIPNPFFGLGIDYRVGILRASSGITAGAGHNVGIPLGITLVTDVVDIGIATRDLPGLFADKNPYYSVAFGLLRFKVGSTDSQEKSAPRTKF